MTIEVPLINGGVALVDDEDADLVSQYRWRRRDNEHRSYASAYAGHRKSERTGQWLQIRLHLHRLILGVSDPAVLVDHWNGDGLDNRRENLRVATNSQNQANSRLTPGRNQKGVWFDRRTGRWAAALRVDGRRIWLGRHPTRETAIQVYDAALVEAFGEYARTNRAMG